MNAKSNVESSPLQGIIVPMITPLSARDRLDEPGLARLVQHLLAGGVHGIFVLGTSGEAPSLSHRLRRNLVTRVCSLVSSRVPVLVGISDTSFVEAIELAQHAASEGADYVVTTAPYYLPPSQPELLDYIDQLVPELPLPLFLYNMPQVAKVQFEIETIRTLAEVQQIVGIKDSSGNLAYFDQLLSLKKLRPDWSMLVGPEHLLAETLRQGGDGGVNGGANVCPELFVSLYRAVKEGEIYRQDELHKKLLELGKIYSVGQHASAVIKGMKCACSLRGLCSDLMAEPFVRFNPPERERVKKILDSLELVRPPEPKS